MWLFLYKFMDFINKQIIKYAENTAIKESNLLSEISRETWAKSNESKNAFRAYSRSFLSMISNMINPKNIIEIGTYTGYSALCLAEGLKNQGELHTIDINEEHMSIASRNFLKSHIIIISLLILETL